MLILGSEIGDPLRCSIVGRDGWTVEMPDSVDTLGEVRAQVRRETNDCAHVHVDGPEDVRVSDDTRVLVDHPRLWVSRMGAVSVVVAER